MVHSTLNFVAIVSVGCVIDPGYVVARPTNATTCISIIWQVLVWLWASITALILIHVWQCCHRLLVQVAHRNQNSLTLAVTMW